ncbi:kinase-like domain-containing protein [Crepidotus variabilis]|uniref:Kinase-like domain-containing protein n=1 Tax=Crepidotus variabilis TaxID=179855 RepID=A0A9P6EC02_9AGAR|nr:kinase-like domain-containing protein [Crepidotus variabilis]
MTHTTIVRNVSIARRAGAYVIGSGGRSPLSSGGLSPIPSALPSPNPSVEPKPTTHSPPSGGSSEEDGSGSSGSISIEHATPTTDTGISSPLFYYLDGTQTPSPNPDKMFDQSAQLASAGGPTPARPTIVINDTPLSASTAEPTGLGTGALTPLSPFQRYRGWLSDVVAPLEEFIDEQVDPREHYLDLNEIAEGESGSVFSATLSPANADRLRLSDAIKELDALELATEDVKMVAIKSIAIVPSGSPKLVDLQRELTMMKGLWHENVLGMDAVYVDLVEDSLWVRMELMERSLADIVGLVETGLMLQERMFARFTSDVLLALGYLHKHQIAHRDVRSDNLLLNKHGVLKLADFSNAVQLPTENSMREDVVGVAFWQAPEIRRGPYNALKVDVWSLGATVWEMAETQPPFADTKQLADRWPPVSQPELYKPAFHDFLRKCSEPSISRPSAEELLKSSFINNACGRPVIVQLLSQCMAIEKLLQEQDDES